MTAAWLVARRLPTLWRTYANSGAAASPRAVWVLCGLSILFAVGISDVSTSDPADALHGAVKSQS